MHKTEKRESREGRSGRGGSGVRRAMNHKLDALQPCRSHLIWPLWSSHARRGLGAWLRQYYDINPACEYTFMSGCVFPSRPLEEDTRKTLSRTAGLDRKRERERKKKEMSSSLADNNVLTPQIPFLMLTVARMGGSEKEIVSFYRHNNWKFFF